MRLKTLLCCSLLLVSGCGILSSAIEKKYEPPPARALPPGYEVIERAEEVPPGAGPERVIVYWLVEASDGASSEAGLEAVTESLREFGFTEYAPPAGYEGWWTVAFGGEGEPSIELGTREAFMDSMSSLATISYITEAFGEHPVSPEREQFVVVFGPRR
jgi:hypothetical protein